MRTLCRTCLDPLGLEVVRREEFDLRAKEEGLDWPGEAETMIGLKRLDNLKACVTNVLRQGVRGDLTETGVWRGGASVSVRTFLTAFGDTKRVDWAADSFQGLPKPSLGGYHADAGLKSWKTAALAIPLENVQENFQRYGLL